MQRKINSAGRFERSCRLLKHVHICAAKAIDRLFSITHHEEIDALPELNVSLCISSRCTLLVS